MKAKVYNRLKSLEFLRLMINCNGSNYFDNEIKFQEELLNDLNKLKNIDTNDEEYFELLKKCYHIKFQEEDYTEISKMILNAKKIKKAYVKSSIVEKSIGETKHSREHVTSRFDFNYINIFLSSNKKDKLNLSKIYSYEDINKMLSDNKIVLIDYKLDKSVKMSKNDTNNYFDKTTSLPFLSFHYSHNINEKFPIVSKNLKQYIRTSLTPEVIDKDISKLRISTKNALSEISKSLKNSDSNSYKRNFSKEEMLEVCDKHLLILSNN